MLHNRKDLIGARRALRRGSTRAEVLLRGALRKRRLAGRKFRRQHSVGAYVLDFYCATERLAVELDGALPMTTRQPRLMTASATPIWRHAQSA